VDSNSLITPLNGSVGVGLIGAESGVEFAGAESGVEFAGAPQALSATTRIIHTKIFFIGFPLFANLFHHLLRKDKGAFSYLHIHIVIGNHPPASLRAHQHLQQAGAQETVRTGWYAWRQGGVVAQRADNIHRRNVRRGELNAPNVHLQSAALENVRENKRLFGFKCLPPESHFADDVGERQVLITVLRITCRVAAIPGVLLAVNNLLDLLFGGTMVPVLSQFVL
jgi:hypothetical protein